MAIPKAKYTLLVRIANFFFSLDFKISRVGIEECSFSGLGTLGTQCEQWAPCAMSHSGRALCDFSPKGQPIAEFTCLVAQMLILLHCAYLLVFFDTFGIRFGHSFSQESVRFFFISCRFCLSSEALIWFDTKTVFSHSFLFHILALT